MAKTRQTAHTANHTTQASVMTVKRIIGLVVLINANACASTQSSPSTGDVLAELSRRSALPPAQLRPLLANCDADQQSRYFCAYRDVVAADLTLELVVADKLRELPACRMPLDRKLASFQRTRDEQCAKSAARDDGEGSMAPTARELCIAASINQLSKDVRHTTQCVSK
jgi:Lysozyme inhibitor LprI